MPPNDRKLLERLTDREAEEALYDWRFWARPNQLPPPGDWTEYRDHLVDNLITDPEHQQWFRETFAAYDARYDGDAKRDLIKTEIGMVLVNDRLGTKLKSFVASHMHSALNRGKRSGRTQDHLTP